jgi:hypothetical protein
MADNPWAGITDLGALDQKLYQQPDRDEPPPSPAKPKPKAKPVAKAEEPDAPKRGIKTRHPFDIYKDQLERLKKLSLQAQMRGEVGSMSAMVREALDNYLKDKR